MPLWKTGTKQTEVANNNQSTIFAKCVSGTTSKQNNVFVIEILSAEGR
jgi:hypothetical protein